MIFPLPFLVKLFLVAFQKAAPHVRGRLSPGGLSPGVQSEDTWSSCWSTGKAENHTLSPSTQAQSHTGAGAPTEVRVGVRAYLNTLDPRNTSLGTVTTMDTTAQTALSRVLWLPHAILGLSGWWRSMDDHDNQTTGDI